MLYLVYVEGDLVAVFPNPSLAHESVKLSFKGMEQIHSYDPNDGEDVSIWFRNGDDLLKVKIETLELGTEATPYLLLGYDPSEG